MLKRISVFPPVPLLVIAGFSGSGKTTFIEKFIPALIHRNYAPAYLKRAGGTHPLDMQGKDSYRQLEAGAAFSAIFTKEKWAMHQQGALDAIWLCSQPQNDLLLVEGLKKSDYPKIVCVHPQEKLPPELDWNHPSPTANVWAYLTAETAQADEINQTTGKLLAFQRNELESIVEHVLNQLNAYYSQTFSLKGAVMVGGKSTRMGKDKAWLEYGQGPHAAYLGKLLSQQAMVQQVVYCGTPLTTPPPVMQKTAFVADRFLNFGPLGGLLTLFETDPEAAWIVLACDLAQLQKETIDHLIQHRNPLKVATVFVRESGRFEPLVAIYEPRMGLHLKRSLLYGIHSFQKIFPQLPIQTLPIPEGLQSQLSNVNTPEERQQTLNILKTRFNKN